MTVPALRARTAAIIDRHHAESVRLLFMKGAVVDPDRHACDISAILVVGSDRPVSPGMESMRSRIAVGEARLIIHRSHYDGPLPRKGDRVRAEDRAGKPIFEVALVSDRHANNVVLHMGEV